MNLVELLSKKTLETVYSKLIRSDNNQKFILEQELDSIATAYRQTEKGFAKDLLLGIYKMLSESYLHEYGRVFHHSNHSTMRKDMRDKMVRTKYKGFVV